MGQVGGFFSVEPDIPIAQVKAWGQWCWWSGNLGSGRGSVPAGLSRQSGYLNDLIMRQHRTHQG